MARKSRKHIPIVIPSPIPEAAGYIRLSVTGKNGDDSIDNQKAILKAWGHKNHIPISKWYVDAGYSGRNFNRPEFKKMIAAIERGEIDCVIVKDLSRLGGSSCCWLLS